MAPSYKFGERNMIPYTTSKSKIATMIEAGLAATIEWYRDNEAWWRPTKAATEEFYAAAERQPGA